MLKYASSRLKALVGKPRLNRGKWIKMFYLYILNNPTTDTFYIGSTNNLRKRLEQHISGKTRTTRILKTYNLVYYEKYKTDSEARNREKKLKSYKSKKYLKWLIRTKNSKMDR